MRNTVILGAGTIGASIAKHLHHSGDYQVTVIDEDADALKRLAQKIPITQHQINANDEQAMTSVFSGQDVVLSACSYAVNPVIANVALKTKCSYFDLTEDVDTTKKIRAIAAHAISGQIFMPQCGLAPGFIGILAHDLCKQFDTIDKVRMRVGALPEFPSNMMKYNLTWSTDGLINEYCNACDAIRDGQLIQVLPLEGLEEFSLDGIDYEAFNTSGGLGTLCETMLGNVKQLDYKTVRYKGHCYLMAFLTKSLQLAKRRHLLKDILENAVPITLQDVVLVLVSVSGIKDGRLTQATDAKKIYHQCVYDEEWSSIQVTTASSACAVVDLFFEGKLPDTGFVKQEHVALADLMSNRFGYYFKSSEA